LRDAVALSTRVHGADDAFALDAFHFLADILRVRHKNDEAQPIFEHCHSAFLKRFGPRYPKTAEAANSLASCLGEFGRDDEALELPQSSLALYKRVPNPMIITKILQCEFQIGRTLFKLKRYTPTPHTRTHT